MQTHHQIQAAIGTLSQAFSPLKCLIVAPRKGSFSFTRLYHDQYSRHEPLQAVIARTRQSLTA